MFAPNKRLRMQNPVRYRPRPQNQWEVVKPLGQMDGGLNAGIFLVRMRGNPKTKGMVFIEKRFGAEEYKHKVPYREIQMLHQIGDHPNITTMIDHFLDESTLTGSVFLEYCDQGSLMSVVERVAEGEHVNEHKVWNWFIQLTEALAYCHRGVNPEGTDDELRGSGWSVLYHRDIKPPNILLTREAHQIVAKLADFGCALSEDYMKFEKHEDYAITASVFTQGYDAPEHPFFSGGSDIWQLAISMLCLCTGNVRPHSMHNPDGQPWDPRQPAGPNYSTELNRVIKGCLKRDRKRRPTVVPVLRFLNKRYDEVRERLTPDQAPLEIFDRRGRRDMQMPQTMPAGRMLTDPEMYGFGTMGEFVSPMLGGHFPPGPWGRGNPRRLPHASMADLYEFGERNARLGRKMQAHDFRGAYQLPDRRLY